MRLLLTMALVILVAGCSSSGEKGRIAPKQDPYEGSVLNTIKENQRIYKEQQAQKGIY